MNKNRKKTLRGAVVSDRMQKTLIVAVTRLKFHPKYKKQYKVTTRYKVHNEKGEFKIGDRVVIQECRPISKEKKWRVVGKV